MPSQQEKQSQALVGVARVRAIVDTPAFKSEMTRVLPEYLPADELIRVFANLAQINSRIGECTSKSLIICAMAFAETGLSPSKYANEAAVVPFGNVATFIVMYQGAVKLCENTGLLAKVTAHIVRENDEFRRIYGTKEELHHIPAEGERGDMVGAYSVWWFKDGTLRFHFMEKEKILKIKEFATKKLRRKDGPWYEWEPEMWLKTVVLHGAKLVPKNTRLQKAIAFENAQLAGEMTESLFDSQDFLNEVDKGELSEGSGAPSQQDAFNKLVKEQPGTGDPKVQAAVLKFLAAAAQGNNCSEDKVIGEVVHGDFPAFWKQFLKYCIKTGVIVKEDRPPTQKTGSVAGDMSADDIIATFSHLRKAGILKYEETHKNKIRAFPAKAFAEFVMKWERIVGEEYVVSVPEQSKQPAAAAEGAHPTPPRLPLPRSRHRPRATGRGRRGSRVGLRTTDRRAGKGAGHQGIDV